MSEEQEYLCQLAEQRYEDKIEAIMDLDILRIEGCWVYIPDPIHGSVAIDIETLI